MATVTNTIKLPDGSIPSHAAVVIELVASTSSRAAGWITANDTTILSVARPTVTAGAWTASLTPNADITPSGTVYKVTETADRARYVHYISVGSGGGTVHDLLVDAPASLASAALSTHIADTSGAHAASAISYNGSTNLAASNVEAALDELDTEKAAIAAGVPTGGARGSVLMKTASTDHAAAWRPPGLLGPTYMVIGDEESERWESWPWLLMVRSGGRITYTQHPDNSVSGATAASSLATFMQWQVPTPPSFTIICFNGKELIAGTVQQFASDMKVLIAAVQAAGSVPVLTTVLPRAVADSNYTTAIRGRFAAASMWIKNYAALAGLPMIDFYGLLTDPTTGLLKSKYIFNSAYFNQTAQRDMADMAFDALGPYLRPWRAMAATFEGDPNNLIANAFTLPDSNADGVPNGWTVEYAGSGTTFSIVSDDRFLGGKAIQIAANSPSTTAQMKSANVNASGTAVSAGDVVAFVCAYSIESSTNVGLGAESGEGLQFYSICPGVLPFFNQHRTPLTGAGYDDPAMPGPLRYATTPQLSTFCGLTYFPVDGEPNPNYWTRSTVALMFRISGLSAGQAMTVRVGNLGVYNLTKMGVVEPGMGYAAGAWNWYNVYADPQNHAYWLAGD